MSNKPKRKRRTKAQIEADKLKAEADKLKAEVKAKVDKSIETSKGEETVVIFSDKKEEADIVNEVISDYKPFTKAEIKYLESRLDNAKRHRPSVMFNVVEIYNRVFDKNVSAYFSYDNYVKIINELKERYENR